MPDVQRLTGEIDSLRDMVAQLQSSIGRNQARPSISRIPPHFEKLRGILLEAEVDAALAGDLIDRAVLEHTDSSPFTPEQVVRRQIAAAVEVEPSIGAERTIIAFTGPAGAGKTSCVAKVAARYGAAARRTTEIIALDSHRVAACEQLRTYAAILGAGFRVITDCGDLPAALEECRRKSLVLIDTPGFALSEGEACNELAAALGAYPLLQSCLVLPCSVRTADLHRLADFYAPFGARRLVFTRLDETDAYGNIINECVRLRKPVSFLSAGPVIPDDLQPADAARIAELLVTPRVAASPWAAAAGV